MEHRGERPRVSAHLRARRGARRLPALGGGRFVHHDAWFPGDRDSLLRAMEDSAVIEPNASFEPMQVVDGDDRMPELSRLRRASAGTQHAVVHIARFEAGSILELGGLAQEVPADSPNALGMF